MYFPYIIQVMEFGGGWSVIGSFIFMKTSSNTGFLWFPVLKMKWNGIPFTHICEWNKHSPSLGSSSSYGYTFKITIVKLGSMLMIHFSLSMGSSGIGDEPKYEAFIFVNNDFLIQQSSLLC
jgi:hypothetical protein